MARKSVDVVSAEITDSFTHPEYLAAVKQMEREHGMKMAYTPAVEANTHSEHIDKANHLGKSVTEKIIKSHTEQETEKILCT